MTKRLDRAVVILRCHRLLDEAGVEGADGRRSLLDRVGDLIAGAPLTTLQGVKEAGVVWILPGSPDGLDFDAMTNVYASDQEEDARVGAMQLPADPDSSTAALRGETR